MAVRMNADVCSLVNTIVTRFDNQRFPAVKTRLHLPDTFDRNQGQVESFIGPQSPLPNEVKVKILFQSNNVAHFILMSKMFQPYDASNDPDHFGNVQETAKPLLKKIGHPTGYAPGLIYTPLEQLFGHIFLEAYANADAQGKEKIINLTMILEPLAEKSYTTAQRILIKIEYIFSVVTGNVVVRWGVSFAVSIQAQRVYTYAKTYFLAYILPRGVNKLINHAPLTVIRGINKGFDACEFLLKYQTLIWLGFVVLQWIPATRIGRTNQLLSLTKKVLLLPNTVVDAVSKVPSKIYNKVFSLSSGTQQRISAELGALKNRSEAHLQARQINQAYRIWMQSVKSITFPSPAA